MFYQVSFRGNKKGSTLWAFPKTRYLPGNSANSSSRIWICVRFSGLGSMRWEIGGPGLPAVAHVEREKAACTRGLIIMFRVTNEFKNARITRTIRFTEKLYEELWKTAKEADVSFNLVVLKCCKYALDHKEDEEKE